MIFDFLKYIIVLIILSCVISAQLIPQVQPMTLNEEFEAMKTKIFVVNSKEKCTDAINYFESFNAKFNYLNEIELIFQPDNEYDELEDDLKTIKRGWSQFAEIIDKRDTVNYNLAPLRLLLTDNFFDLSVTEKDEIILHELGHFFTNPDLIEMRQYIAEKNPPIVSINRTDLQNLISKHNKALNYVFQIPKLVQEVRAELWVFEHERKYSESRIARYCKNVEQSLKDFSNASVDNMWFYQIPELNFLILWRLAIVKYLDFDYSENCIQNTNEANELFKELAATVNWDKLKMFELQDDLLKCLEHKNENSKKLIEISDEIFDDFILNSAGFFPTEIQTSLVKFYQK